MVSPFTSFGTPNTKDIPNNEEEKNDTMNSDRKVRFNRND